MARWVHPDKRQLARKGGQSVPDEKRPFSQDHELASEAGRKGAGGSHRGDKAGVMRFPVQFVIARVRTPCLRHRDR
ncbi:Stress-induced acidophilic repeat motif-containing protein [Bradyrhizobium lablabi]|uniref:Stress-induced acidophilic repeat motif-containing protein n=1 Tax=Bradyrhizobium lablabi TaxID=722472 RepID=A0A1M7F0N6_9BRAD|nr:Stress-induced acidophilic repeat motif-containing protein [Bradyrhizobium lablabi]